jgi:MFS family permease
VKIPAAFDALRDRDFRLLWLGAEASLLSAQMRQIANGFLAYELTGSAAILAAVTLAQSLPSLFLSMFGGVVADRVKRRKLLLFSQSFLFFDSLAVTILVVTGLIQVWHIALIGVLHGSVLAFNQPARQAYMVELAGSQNVTQAIALYSSGQTAVRIIGPSIAGALLSISAIGVEGAFVVIATCYTLPVVSLFFIKARPPETQRKRRPLLTEFNDGIRYIRNHEVLRLLIIVGLVPPLLGNHYQQFLPVFASDVLHVGDGGFGFMSTATGIGAFFGAMAVASYGHMRRRGLMQLGAGALFGLSLAIFALSPSFAFALLALLVVGFAFTLFQTLNSTLTLASSDPEYYGRVSAVQQLNNSFGSFVIIPMGVLIDSLGAPTVIFTSGVLIFTFWCFVGLFVRSYRRIEMPAKPAEEEVTATPAPNTHASQDAQPASATTS